MPVANFRKKPVVVQALQYTHENAHLFAGWMQYQPTITPENTMKIATLEGMMTASYGDWIIKGVHGEFYPCKPDIFELTYKRVSGWPQEFQSSMDDCNHLRCRVLEQDGQCHLKPGHPGVHDPLGASHWEASEGDREAS